MAAGAREGGERPAAGADHASPGEHSRPTAFVAGASRGIGAEVARNLRGGGWRVLTASRTDPRDGHRDDWVCADLGTEAGRHTATQFLDNQTQRLDGLVVCAGTLFVEKTQRISGATALGALDANVGPLVGVLPTAIQLMRRRRYGRIVVVGSVGAYRVSSGNGRYALSKAALEGIVRTAARELGPLGITVNVVAPGFTDTAMVARGSAEWRAQRQAEVPRGRFADPAEVAASLVQLLDPRASFINGATLMIDGGYAMGR